MRRRVWLALATVLALGACTDPTGPRNTQPPHHCTIVIDLRGPQPKVEATRFCGGSLPEPQ